MNEILKNNGKKYVYAIIDSEKEESFGQLGVEDSAVYSVCEGSICAVVSDISVSKIRPRRKQLAAHQNVLKFLLERHAVLPFSFGMIANNLRSVRGLLARNLEELDIQLRDLANKVEMGLRVEWDVENIFEYFIESYPHLRDLRDKLFAVQSTSREDRIEVGREFDMLLRNTREVHTNKVISNLSSHCVDVRDNPPRSEKEILNLAFLIERNHLSEFEAQVDKTAEMFTDEYRFHYSGPWAPHNFIEIELDIQNL
jgi:hypothetical protein